MVTISFIIQDDDFKNIETHKWNVFEWERVEKTFSYLRRKYGKPRSYKQVNPGDDSSWVQE